MPSLLDLIIWKEWRDGVASYTYLRRYWNSVKGGGWWNILKWLRLFKSPFSITLLNIRRRRDAESRRGISRSSTNAIGSDTIVEKQYVNYLTPSKKVWKKHPCFPFIFSNQNICQMKWGRKGAVHILTRDSKWSRRLEREGWVQTFGQECRMTSACSPRYLTHMCCNSLKSHSWETKKKLG